MSIKGTIKTFIAIVAITSSFAATAQEALFETIGSSSVTNLPEHMSQAQKVRVNRRALPWSLS